VDDRGDPVADTELEEDRRDVPLDRALTQVQRTSDLGVVGTGGDQAEHLPFAFGERVEGRHRPVRLPAHRVEDPAGDPRVEPRAATSGDPDGADEIRRGRVLEDETGRAGLDRAPQHLVVFERGEREYVRRRGVLEELAGRLDPV
jgi:hypothetical protein